MSTEKGSTTPPFSPKGESEEIVKKSDENKVKKKSSIHFTTKQIQ